METKDIKEIKTTRGILQYYRDWGMEGHIVMLNPQTIERYKEIRNSHPDGEKLGFFFAFSNEQFNNGKKMLISKGHLKEGQKLCYSSSVNGLFGTKEGLDGMYSFYDDNDKKIKEECDPQEVYFYEYNNHECMFTNDSEAYDKVKSIFGEDVAIAIKRIGY